VVLESLRNSYRTNKSLLKKWYLLHKVRVPYRKKINKLYNHLVKNRPHKNIKLNIKGYREKWESLNKYVNPLWYKTFSYTSGIEDINYVPEDLFYGIIEPTLNDFSVAIAYTDKNLYDKFYSGLNIFPETMLRNLEGSFYNSDYEYLEDLKSIENYIGDEQKLIVKPALESGGGRNVQIFYRENNSHYYNKNGEKLDFNYLIKNYNKNFLVQKYIEQGNYFKQFNDTSLNTMRIYTYRSVSNNDIFISNSLLRIGKKGTEIDNVSLGGICLLVDKDGKLGDYAIDLSGNKYFSLPWDESFKFSNLEKIPEYDKIIDFVKEIARRNYYQRLLGLDVCVDKDNNIRLIEINNEECDINMFQILGSAVFREYTDEVIEYCKDNKRRRLKNIR